jgi:hypothetical protein
MMILSGFVLLSEPLFTHLVKMHEGLHSEERGY